MGSNSMNATLWVIVGLLAVAAADSWWVRTSRARRLNIINGYRFPDAIRRRVQSRYPHLTETDLDSVFSGLRQYFRLVLGRRALVSMPSQVVDVAWHEFILFTRDYRDFCQRGLGRFLHHVPAEAMGAPTEAQEGIRRAWYFACRDERIAPRQAHQLPLLFALDAELGIADGFRYSLDCLSGAAAGASGASYCGSHIGCGSSWGGSGGCGGGGDSSGDGHGGGGHGGCGGGGDGGGCGGSSGGPYAPS